MNLPDVEDAKSPLDSAPPAHPSSERRARSLALATPSSCGGASVTSRYAYALSPTTPDPNRADLKLLSVDADVGAVIFDFDGTLTATRGDFAQRSQKCGELQERASFLRPWLQGLRDAGMTLGIMSKSSEQTIRTALQEAELIGLFDGGPIIGKAVGFDGKAGFIEDLVVGGGEGEHCLVHLGLDGVQRVLLVDDDVRELDRARAWGIQTYPAPEEGGLTEADFKDIFSLLGLPMPA